MQKLILEGFLRVRLLCDLRHFLFLCFPHLIIYRTFVVLQEELIMNDYRGTIAYIRCGPRAEDLLAGKCNVMFSKSDRGPPEKKD